MITIIGGSVAGGYLGSLLNDDVRIIEEHKKIGEPVQCTGIVSNDFKDLIKEKSFIVNKIKNVELNSSNEKLFFKLKKEDFVLDRRGLDKYLVDKAVDNGADLVFGKFLDFNGKVITNQKKYNTDVLVGADGGMSQVAKVSGLYGERKFLVGKQVRCKMKNDGDVYRVFFNIPEFFSWIVPESEDICRIGCASYKNVDVYFNKFLKKFDVKVLENNYGLIPKYGGMRTSKDNVYLVGDAALQIKDLTGGGIVPGLKCAKVLSDCLNNGKDYEKEWRKEIGRNLWMNYKLRRILDKFDSSDWDKFLRLLKQYNVHEFNRDYIKLKDFMNFRLFWFVFRKMIS
ncbi:MAG: NAD(P)/FAD-dependent oxidoreductase [Nanoarchaeota archaeon]|nr:NAD(P)/FAD-dependent oxidoreductase [Nanoarchaeota archaeon]